jgi:hypothetical protein
MKTLWLAGLVLLAGLFATCAAKADTYNLTVSWTDETVYLAEGEVPRYDVKFKVTEAGEENSVLDQTAPAASAVVVADPGQQVLVAARSCSVLLDSRMCQEWSDWVIATAAHGQTMPLPVSNLQIILVRQ